MRLDSKNWFVIWAFLPTWPRLPERTDVCTMVRNAFVTTPLFLFLMVVVVPIGFATLCIIEGARWLHHHVLSRGPKVHMPSVGAFGVVSQWFRDKHDKVCTTVEIK